MRFPWSIGMVFASALVVTSVTMPSASGASAQRFTEYYVSVGDSYAAGYQPLSIAQRHRDTNGFAYQVVALSKAKGYHLSLKNFACDGATTATVIDQTGCSLPNPGPDTAFYPKLTQAAAAERFLTEHRGHVGLITVSLSGNDILGCTNASILNSCMTNALTGIEANMTTLLSDLRQAAGPSVPIIGITYPDVFLGLYTSKDPAAKALAVPSINAFRTILNPALDTLYSAVNGSFVDVTQATGAYIPLSQMSKTAHSRSLPVAVADVCDLTYYCQEQDVHPTAKGYALIARLIIRALAKVQ